jgi:PAS domain S-box-containing protein
MGVPQQPSLPRPHAAVQSGRDDPQPAAQAEAASPMESLESEHIFRDVFRASPVGIGLSDEDGHFVASNDALCALFGRPESELLARSTTEFTHPDDLATNRNAETMLTSAPDGVVRLEKRYIRPNGEVRWAWLTVTMAPGPGGEP